MNFYYLVAHLHPNYNKTKTETPPFTDLRSYETNQLKYLAEKILISDRGIHIQETHHINTLIKGAESVSSFHEEKYIENKIKLQKTI